MLRRLVGPNYQDRRYLVAVSGGVDSVVLLDLLRKAVTPDQILVAHFDHRVRASSSRDAQFVKRQAERLGLSYFEGVRLGTATSENGLRTERLKFLKRTRQQSRCDYILTAHHADDQMETFCMRLLRGTGLTGLGAMAPKRGRFLKPLLPFPKSEILAYAKKRELVYREDESNASGKYLRNRVRHQLLPAWKELFEAYGGELAFYRRFTSTIREIQSVTDTQGAVGKWLSAELCTRTDYWVRLAHESFLALSPADQALLLREVVRGLRVETLTRLDLERARRSVREGKTVSLPGIQLTYSCGFVYFQTPMMEKLLKAASPDFERIEIDETKLPGVQVRTMQPGDHLGRTKLKKILLELRIPKLERALLPVVAKKGSSEVLWCWPLKPLNGITLRSIEFPFAFQS
jgi:tRNA(Ile)-lysidine synthetase-like protein